MWRALIGSIKHEERRENGEQEVNQAAALSDLVIFLSYVTHKSEEMKENDQGRQKKGSCLYKDTGPQGWVEVVFI